MANNYEQVAAKILESTDHPATENRLRRAELYIKLAELEVEMAKVRAMEDFVREFRNKRFI